MSEPQLILIVEDEPKIAELLRDYLQQSGYATHRIDNGDFVDEWARNNDPDLVLLDLMLPGGFDKLTFLDPEHAVSRFRIQPYPTR